MKSFVNFLIILLAFSFVLSGCTESEPDIPPVDEIPNETDFVGIWLTCYEIQMMRKNTTEDSFRAEVEKMLDVCNEKGITAVFVQVRPFADALYSSELFPLSEYAVSASGKEPRFDILQVMIEMAQERNIEIHAWINPYRISYKTDLSQLPDNSIARNDEYGGRIVCLQEGIYFDPSDIENQQLILSGVREILDKYDVDGIHIDDYFYPQTEEKFDKKSYDEYKEQGGKLRLGDWRRENVNALIGAIYSLVHSYPVERIFSISPCGDIGKNISSHYADVKLWLSTPGYADMVIPQLYYGFEHEDMPFESAAEKWLKLKRFDEVELVCGLACYKQGKADSLAGSGSDEWLNSDDIIERQIEYLNTSAYSGYVLFSYSDIKD